MFCCCCYCYYIILYYIILYYIILYYIILNIYQQLLNFIHYANIIFYKLPKLLLLKLHILHIMYVIQHYVCKVQDLYLPMQLSTFLFYTFVISLMIATVNNPNMQLTLNVFAFLVILYIQGGCCTLRLTFKYRFITN